MIPTRCQRFGRPAPAAVLAGVLVLMMSAVAGVAVAAIAPPITFRFNPPDGLAFTETLKTTQVTDTGAGGKRMRSGATTGRVVVRKTTSGYRLTSTIISSKQSSDGRTAPGMDSLLAGIVVTYELDRQGQVVAVLGYDELVRRVRQQLTRQLGAEGAARALAAASGSLSPAALEKKDKAEWRARVGGLAGRTVRLGQVVASTSDYTLPAGGTVTFYTTTKFARRVRRAGHDCVELEFTYSTDAKAVAALMGKTLSQLGAAVGAAKLPTTASDVSITGQGRRIVDPATLMPYGEKTSRTITVKVNQPGRGLVPVRRIETREYAYSYAGPRTAR